MKFNKLTSILTGIATAATLLCTPVIAEEAEDGVVTEYYSGGPDIRFKVRNLKMWSEAESYYSKDKATNKMTSPLLSGTIVEAELEYFHDCTRCGTAINQIIVGIVDTETRETAPITQVSACIFSGGQKSGGWKTARFQIDVPNGDHDWDVRVRYAQDYGCERAMKNWWTIDAGKKGPRKENTIGSIETFP